ncbi:MAG: Rpn family recombination-promoting nuclease/putative transposase [Moorea sp. SIO4E2]|uniref:Rpn family recombination-promoting nuclease/putative transposase n=1 Tax=Moorena sp. SIO4E2 TaxID=2607826 RepID=UPI0013BA791C|nr:Rpn family recombination-promoting nuclease/putative transposase [Moorena sp. SIO4E2]NEQ11491.1 Rpn family recombination-promoting nuclease/putative transposase [Moorena sp. SIO4E2]
MKTDTIFYRLFQSFPSIFFELINHSPTEAQAYQFASVEVKQLAFRIDGVFLPTTTTAQSPIYFVEVQFQRDSEFYSRFFTEIFIYLNKNKISNDWRGVVIYPSRNVDKGATQQYQELLDSPRVSRIYLDELAETPAPSVGIATVQLIVTEEDSAISLAQDLIQRTTEEIDNERQKRELLQLIETILVYKLPKLSRTEIEAMFSLSDLRQTKVYQEAKAEGRLEGIQEGIQEGEIQGKLKSIPRLLALGLTVEQVAQALELEVKLVKQVLEQSTDP